ncbi:MAG: 7-carboxy-7-deazaguanine synthase QueE [Gammaproteobacteria bacterium]
MSEVRITEIFHSLQGESSLTGLPTVFVRLTGCPLRCVYCDTEYAFNGGKKQTIDQILETVASYECERVCVTGGEPLAQPECLTLLTSLCDSGYQVSIETSGAMDVSMVDSRVIKVMDLKTPDSGEMARNRYDNIYSLDSKDQVKFVIASKTDYDWSTMQVAQYKLNEKLEVLFSPVYEKLAPATLAQWILDDRLEVRMQVQLHKILWGEQQGV